MMANATKKNKRRSTTHSACRELQRKLSIESLESREMLASDCQLPTAAGDASSYVACLTSDAPIDASNSSQTAALAAYQTAVSALVGGYFADVDAAEAAYEANLVSIQSTLDAATTQRSTATTARWIRRMQC
jgi:hypothetical protein